MGCPARPGFAGVASRIATLQLFCRRPALMPKCGCGVCRRQNTAPLRPVRGRPAPRPHRVWVPCARPQQLPLATCVREGINDTRGYKSCIAMHCRVAVQPVGIATVFCLLALQPGVNGGHKPPNVGGEALAFAPVSSPFSVRSPLAAPGAAQRPGADHQHCRFAETVQQHCTFAGTVDPRRRGGCVRVSTALQLAARSWPPQGLRRDSITNLTTAELRELEGLRDNYNRHAISARAARRPVAVRNRLFTVATGPFTRCSGCGKACRSCGHDMMKRAQTLCRRETVSETEWVPFKS